MPDYEITVTVTETRTYRGRVKAPAENVALDMVEDAAVMEHLVSGQGVQLALVKVDRVARSPNGETRRVKLSLQ